jgi:tetratricopeptide (TPR) repeat protein
MAGTLAYMAPEQIQGKARPASDQYALGVVVYEWISGTRPFSGASMEIIAQHLSIAPPPLCGRISAASPEIERVVMKALAKDPKERFARIRDFAIALEEVNQSVRFQPPPPLVVPLTPVQVPQSGVPVPAERQALQTNNLDVYQKTKEQWFSQAFTLYEAERYAEALIAFENAIQLDSKYGYAYSGRALTLYQLKRYQDALMALERALQLNPNDAMAYYASGLAMEQLQKYTEALQAFERVTQLDPKYASAWRKKGDALCGLKRYEDALSAYEHALELDPNDADTYIGKGKALKYLGRSK